MFPAFSLPCRLCLLLSCHAECTGAGSAPSCEGQVPLWGCGLRTIFGGAILLWHTWAASSMPWVGSAPPCGDHVPTWGQGPCTITWWRRAMLIASLGQELPLSHPSVTGMLVWHVGTRLHAAHRQSFADGLITWIACPPSTSGLLCRGACGPVAAAALPTQPCMVASCTGRDRVLLAGRLDWHLSIPCSDSATQHPCSDYSRMLAMRKSCKMDTGWASC